jgi:site-specific DNA recombinase
MVCRRTPRHSEQGTVGQGSNTARKQPEKATRTCPGSIVESANRTAGGREWQSLYAILHVQEKSQIPLLLAIKNPDFKFTGPLRLPAREIENLVTERLASFLRSDGDVFDLLGGGTDSPAASQQLVEGAKSFVEGWPSVRSTEFRDLLHCFVRRVIIHEDIIKVLVSRAGLRQVLEKGDSFVPTHDLSAPHKSVHPDDLICLTIEAKLKRSGGEVHLVIPPNLIQKSSQQTNPSLMKAVARGRVWYERVLEGKSSDQRSLTLHAGVTERYVGLVFGCAFLAPDIVEAILEGRQPRDLTFKKLCSNVPFSWTEQRRQFGFSGSRKEA